MHNTPHGGVLLPPPAAPGNARGVLFIHTRTCTRAHTRALTHMHINTHAHARKHTHARRAYDATATATALTAATAAASSTAAPFGGEHAAGAGECVSLIRLAQK